MVVGLTRLTLAIPGNDSLKGKRSVVRKLLERVRSRFHVSAAEVDLQDVHQRAVLGICTVGSDSRKIESVLEKVVSFIDDAGLAQIVSVESETVNYSEMLGDGAYESYADKFGSDDEWPPRDVDPIVESNTGSDSPTPPASPAPSKTRKITLRPGSLGFGSHKAEDEEPS